MAIKLQKDAEKHLIGSIKTFFSDELESDIGDLKAQLVLDFFLKEVSPTVYNQAVKDAQSYFQDKVSDLGDVRHETEFDYWKKQRPPS
ncbi:MAG: hypothetical protein FD126_3273 [Elusimicrobia bacterium]|nr:MAG: hypothetical protein FD126_3273 [Elusimicrobiota bacterium]